MAFSLKEILSLSLDIGERMLKCGGEVSRVEETINIICQGYGVKFREVFVINSLIVATLRKDDESVTESRRIIHLSRDLNQLEKLNSLSREICKNHISRNEVLKRIDSYKQPKHLTVLFGQILAAVSFTLFFKGNILDGIVSFIIAVVLFAINYLIRNKGINQLIMNFIESFIIGVLAIILCKVGIGVHKESIMIGCIMLLIPGLAMFTSVNDMFKGDTVSGATRFIEGLFSSLVIAAGIGCALLLGGAL